MIDNEEATIEEIEAALEFVYINRDLIIKSLPVNADFSESLVDGLYKAYDDFHHMKGYTAYQAVKVRELVNLLYSDLYKAQHTE